MSLVPVAWRNWPKMLGLGARACTKRLRPVQSHPMTQCSSCFMRSVSNYPHLPSIHEQLVIFNCDAQPAVRVGRRKSAPPLNSTLARVMRTVLSWLAFSLGGLVCLTNFYLLFLPFPPAP